MTESAGLHERAAPRGETPIPAQVVGVLHTLTTAPFHTRTVLLDFDPHMRPHTHFRLDAGRSPAGDLLSHAHAISRRPHR